jgi:hypothetical protein
MAIVAHSPIVDDAPPVPFFSFEDAGARALVARFAADWGDAQAAEGWHAGLIVDVDDLDGQGEIEAGEVLATGAARTDDASAFIKAFAGAWADGYYARIRFALRRGY